MNVISAQIKREHPQENDGIGAARRADARRLRRAPCGRRSDPAWRRRWRCCSSAARTSRICSSRARWSASASSPSARRSARDACASSRSRSPSSCRCSSPAAPLGLLAAAWGVQRARAVAAGGSPAGREHRAAACRCWRRDRRCWERSPCSSGIWPALEASRGGLAASVADLSRGTTGALAPGAHARRPRRRADRGDAVARDRRDAADAQLRRAEARHSRVQCRRASTPRTSRFRDRSTGSIARSRSSARASSSACRRCPDVVSAGHGEPPAARRRRANLGRSSSRASIPDGSMPGGEHRRSTAVR